jgi:hypothetical protein
MNRGCYFILKEDEGGYKLMESSGCQDKVNNEASSVAVVGDLHRFLKKSAPL